MNKSMIIGGVALVAAIAVGAGAMGFGTKTVAPVETGAMSTPASEGLLQKVASTDAGDLAPAGFYKGITTESGGFTGDVLEGSADATVTVIEYASLTCPHCASFHNQTYKKLKTEYIDTGKINFIYRDYPLNDPAMAATLIARCAGPDKYLAFIDLFLTQQSKWTSSQDLMGELRSMAKFGGLGDDRINECLRDRDLGQSVLDRMHAGTEAFKVNSTPTVIINGKNYSGGRDFGSMSKFIDGML